MKDRDAIAHELNALEQGQKELEILYEQYFAGIEKREPVKAREDLALRLRRFANRRIMQTDLRFRYQNLATRYHSYSGHWDRILRLMDESRYPRHLQRAPAVPGGQSAAAAVSAAHDDVETVYRQLLEAGRMHKTGIAIPDRQQIAAFLERQKEKIRDKFGDREVEFRVVTEDGKPKIKVRAKS
ncbi:MAG TPA: MXAN_5187 C-terminal domain-containing protein [Desulfuromonadales bacterium]|nr:MXAN_5187 C-terminal domain-containing protein [Desulfuromonadales bacterium]